MPDTFTENYFGPGAELYARHRPDYPDALFELLADLAEPPARAWDCATGSGQAARGLARHFDEVVATDSSAEQIAMARGPAHVEFVRAPAEASGLAASSVDLVAVATALHWFDLEAFWEEARRVARPGGLLAIWCYERATPGDDEVAARFEELSSETLGPFWDERIQRIESAYEAIEVPFPELEDVAAFTTRRRWATVEDLFGYVGTWSAVERYRRAHGVDPRDADLRATFESIWPEGGVTVEWRVQPRIFHPE